MSVFLWVFFFFFFFSILCCQKKKKVWCFQSTVMTLHPFPSLFGQKNPGEKRLISGRSVSLLAHPLILLTVINVFSVFRVFHGDFSLCVDYMQYILSYRSRFRPLSSLCSLVWGRGGGRGPGGEWACLVRGVGWGQETRGPAPSGSLYCSLSETSPGLWNFVLVAFAKTKNGFVESPFFLAASFLSL